MAFTQHIKTQSIALVDMDPRLVNFYRHKKDYSFEALVRNPQAAAFVKFPIKGCDRTNDYFLLRKGAFKNFFP